MFYGPAVFSRMWAPNWWLSPGYDKHVEAVFATIGNPDYPRAEKHPIPPAPPDTDLARVRKLMLSKPWELSEAVCKWLIYDVGELHIDHDADRPR